MVICGGFAHVSAVVNHVRSRRRAVTDWRWTLCLILLTPPEHE